MTDTMRQRPMAWKDINRGVRKLATARISRLQRDYRNDRSDATATLAQLRRGVDKPPGSIPEIWEATMLPDDLLDLRGHNQDKPTQAEWAVHLTMTLYAVHQQSQHDADMHLPDQGFGAAVGLLSRASTNPEAVRRRFVAAGTATDLRELIHHVRGLVGQLRQHKIGIDYGMFTDDLHTWQTPWGPDAVRRRWGRDFHRISTKQTKTEAEEQDQS